MNLLQQGLKETPSVIVSKGEADPVKRSRLRLSLYVWSKLQFMCHRGPTEIGGWGIGEPDDPLLITDFLLVPQEADAAYVEFTDDGMGQYCADQDVLGRKSHQYQRVWCHTHPGSSASPSGQDVANFGRVFEHTDFGVMFILARDGAMTCRMRVNGVLKFQQEIPVDVSHVCTKEVYEKFKASDWEAEYVRCVKPRTYAAASSYGVRTYLDQSGWEDSPWSGGGGDAIDRVIDSARQEFRFRTMAAQKADEPKTEVVDKSARISATFADEWIEGYREDVEEKLFMSADLPQPLLEFLRTAGVETVPSVTVKGA